MNSLLLKIKAQNFAWGVLCKHSIEIRRKNKSDFFDHSTTLSQIFSELKRVVKPNFLFGF